MLSVSGYLRTNNDMISHVSFLAPMASDPNVNTMYYGHANVGNMVNLHMMPSAAAGFPPG